MRPLEPFGEPAQPHRVGEVLAAAAQGRELLDRVAPIALDPAAIAHQGGQRRQGGRRHLATLGPRQHRVLDRAQPDLPPGGEHQLLDQMRLGRVHGLPAAEESGTQGRELAGILALAQDHGPGAQAVAGGVERGAGLALGADRAIGQGTVGTGNLGFADGLLALRVECRLGHDCGSCATGPENHDTSPVAGIPSLSVPWVATDKSATFG